MNVVPYGAVGTVPVLDRVLQFARQNPAVVNEARRLIRHYGPAAVDYARNAGYEVGRLVRAWFQRHARPRNHFMQRVRAGLARQQDVRFARNALLRLRSNVVRPSQSVSFQRRGTRGMMGMRRGGWSMRRGGQYRRPRYGVRRGGRPLTYRNLRPELKAIDQSVGVTSISNVIAATSSPISTITQGSGSNNRIGKKILVKSMTIAGKVTSIAAPTVSNADDTVWIWIVLDTQSNGTSGIAADIWNPTTAHNALKNLDGGPRFKILKCIEIKVSAIASGVSVNQPFEDYLKLNIPVSYVDTGGTPPRKNNIMVYAGTSGGGAANLQVDYYTRVRYYDA